MTAPVAPPPKLDWQTQRNQLDMLNRLAMQDLTALVRRAQEMDPWAGREYLEEALRNLLGTYGGSAAELSAAWWDEISMDDVYFAETATLPPQEQLVKQVRWGTAPFFGVAGNPMIRLAGVAQRHIFGMHRDTITLNSASTGVRYARFAQADACAFCRVLSSRGAVYGSESAAKYVGSAGMQAHYSDGRRRGTRFKPGRQPRGVQKAGDKFHDHCRCVVGPDFDHMDLNEPSYWESFEDEYTAAAAQIDGVITIEKVTALMRAAGHGA